MTEVHNNQTILIVDDEPDIIDLIKINLVREGYLIHTALTGEEALKKLSNDDFDIVLMDVTLPDISGIDVTKEYRRQAVGQHHLPIIALTAHAHSDDKELCLASGMDDFMVKPLSPEALKAILVKYASLNRL